MTNCESFTQDMKHNIALSCLAPNSDQIVVKIQLPEFLTDESRISNPGSVLGSMLSVWNRLSVAGRSERELVVEISFPKKRKRDGLEVQSLSKLREFAETTQQALRYSSILCTMKLIIHNLRGARETTFRDIYYRDIDAFQRSQIISNRNLKLISQSMTLLLGADLKVCPSPKGLIYGGPNIELDFGNAAPLTLSWDRDPGLIPGYLPQRLIRCSGSPEAIIVFEKEAVFKSFYQSAKFDMCSISLILITGKGFADGGTKSMLQAIHTAYPAVPISVFVDSDVFGLRIYWDYLLSISTRTANFFLAGAMLLEHRRGMVTIRDREWRLLINFVKENEQFRLRASPQQSEHYKIHKELTRGLLLGKKAEMNVLASDDHSKIGQLNNYLWSKIAKTRARDQA